MNCVSLLRVIEANCIDFRALVGSGVALGRVDTTEVQYQSGGGSLCGVLEVG
jgi:hypothetical protein